MGATINDELKEYRMARLYPEKSGADQRGPFERDRDRILYSTAFRRLAGVTQVVGVSEGHNFHNRLTHSLKVAQISRRLAQYLIAEQPAIASELALDPEVAEAAALAHDIGHPPFGHVAEAELQRLVDEHWEGDNPDGFEGNPQSFRIVTKLSLRTQENPGLNLTRATLAALLKYPWLRADDPADWKRRKYGAYRSEQDELTFATRRSAPRQRSIEAEIMDWADDIAYSVHDLEDFYRVGIVPLGSIVRSDINLDKFLRDCQPLWWEGDAPPTESDMERVRDRVAILLQDETPREMLEPYEGRQAQRAAVRNWSSRMVGRYVRRSAIRLRRPTSENMRLVEIKPEAKQEVTFLKTLTRHYVIRHPSLAAQQYGQQQIISQLFRFLMDIVSSNREYLELPVRWREVFARVREESMGDTNTFLRLVADVIGDMTEQEAIAYNRRLTGTDSGSLLNPIIQ